ncbi:metallophosphoesterase [Limnohabitans sp. Rim8]|uniref:metallophosphoesterase n=1 Tax=Limnohabitans sp. Rim8 TaxID=1100718 RepID=UPI0025E33221|nr:metallophosphoesterase [Limnohabitans sp. Rim8]
MITLKTIQSHTWKVISFAAVVLFFYGFFIEPQRIEVIKWSRQVGLGGITLNIVQLSDLHISEIGQTEHKTLEQLKLLKPNIILLSGDVIDHRDSLPALNSFLSDLPPSIKIAILGNWEHWSGVDLKALAATYEKNDVTLLVNQCISFSNTGLRLSVAGFDDYTAGQPDVDRTFRQCGKEDQIIIAEHSPGLFDENPRTTLKKIAFSMAGHTHGGQFAIGNNALITPPGSGRFVAGWYQTEWGDLYVSKGIGTSVIPLRIGARPEITIFELK